MIRIHLEQLQFYAYHGLYKEESVLGNEYIVDITLEYQPEQKLISTIDQTVDYTKIYELIAQRMKIQTDLLETIASEFCYQILHQFKSVDSIFFTIKKLNPPISQCRGNVGVSYQLNRSDL